MNSHDPIKPVLSYQTPPSLRPGRPEFSLSTLLNTALVLLGAWMVFICISVSEDIAHESPASRNSGEWYVVLVIFVVGATSFCIGGRGYLRATRK